MSNPNPFTVDTLGFLSELRTNNNREWFNANKSRYESVVREPALAFIEAMQAPLGKISNEFPALPRRVGGSLMRVYRDTRFARDKTPYKTNIGIQFRHRLGKDVHAPGFYLHIEPDACFLGVGIWRPDSRTLNRIREFLVDNPAAWRKATTAAGFKRHFALQGDSLVRPPRGYASDHPLIGDLKRKDFIAIAPADTEWMLAPGLDRRVAERFAHAGALVRYLCAALDLPF